MQIFVDDDNGYLRWLRENASGFVVNADRPPNPSYLRLHHARCRTISGEPANGRAWTATSTKTCGTRQELEAWATTVVGGNLSPCPACL